MNATLYSKLIHRGSRPEQTGPILIVGTDDPDVWEHWLTIDDLTWRATLKSDLVGREISILEILLHFQRYHHHPCSPWSLHIPEKTI